MAMGHTETGRVFMPMECQQLSTAVEKRRWSLWKGVCVWGGQKGKGGRTKGVTLAGSCSWTPSKVKREGNRKQNGGNKYPSITFKRDKSGGARRERDSGEQQQWERTERGGCVWLAHSSATFPDSD